ncbi:hypothetical protein L1887_55506 [Cichorium endivia]|nr:hypothetical protein L1887_55506 [Cichorium endivia]
MVRRLASHDDVLSTDVVGAASGPKPGVGGPPARESKNSVHSCCSGYLVTLTELDATVALGLCIGGVCVASLRAGLLGAALAACFSGSLVLDDATATPTTGLASIALLAAAGAEETSVACLLGEGGVEGRLGLPPSADTDKPFRDMRSRISSRLGRPLASMRLVGEQAPDEGAVGERHKAASLSSLVGEAISGLLRSASWSGLGEPVILPVSSSLGRAASAGLASACLAGDVVGVAASLSRLSRAAMSLSVGILLGDRVCADLVTREGETEAAAWRAHMPAGMAFSSCVA